LTKTNEPRDTLPTAAAPSAAVQPTLTGAPIATSLPPELPASMPTMAAATGGQPMSMPPAMPTLSGAQLSHVLGSGMPDRYTLQSEIARGGMGRVVEALDTVLGRVVAVKEALSFDADSLARFQRETKITARLEHPSIVPVHDAGTTSDGMPFYVMRKIGGRALETLVAMTPDVKERLGLIPHLVHAAQAVAHAHERGIVHRDIKPSNILVGELGETMVIDWGLAKVIGESDEAAGAVPDIVADDDKIHTRVGIVFGTPGFMAPEQLRGSPVDERCDVYALGATLYHVLARKPPHHSKNADEMMRAAVDGPPTPITEMVAGIPRELGTIVDKALAHDVAQRYQNARELAEDLNRFLTGQLVASHHYTTKERLQRFARKHLATLVAAGIGLVALIAIGTFAVVRIVDARDRAEHERQVAIERADQLALGQARFLVDSDPARAIATLRPLAKSHWRETGAIAVAARAAGVPWGIAVSPETVSIEHAPDGRRAIVTGDDGVVRELDLAAHTSRVVLDAKAPVRARYIDAKRIVVFGGTKIAVVELAGARRDLVAATPIVDLRVDVTRRVAYWVDDAQGVWQMGLDDPFAQSVQLAMPEPITALAPSPDGRWLALAGASHLLAFDLAAPAQPPSEALIGVASQLAWTPDGGYLAVVIDERVATFRSGRDFLQLREKKIAETSIAARFVHDHLYFVEDSGVRRLEQGEPELRKQLAGSRLGLHEARGGTLVTPLDAGPIHVLSPDGDRVLHPPLAKLTMLAASPASPFVIGAYRGLVLVWNLDDLQPKQVAATPAVTLSPVGATAVIATFEKEPATWIELSSGVAIPLLGITTTKPTIVAPPSGKVAISVAAGAATLVAPNAPPVLLGPADRALFVAETHAILASGDKLRLVELATKSSVELPTPAGVALHLAWARPNHVAATYADKLWRYDRAAGRGDQVGLPGAPTSPPTILGDATYVALDRKLYAWDARGELRLHATLPATIVELAALDPSVVAFDRDGRTYVIDDRGDVTIGDPVGTPAAMAATTGRIVSLAGDGALAITEPLARQRFTLAPSSIAPFSSPTITLHGDHVIASTPVGVFAWLVPVTPDAAAVAQMLGAMSNVTLLERGTELGWP